MICPLPFRYLPTGPLALLPLWGNYCSIVWSTPVTESRRLLSLTPEEFLVELNIALQHQGQSHSVASKCDGSTVDKRDSNASSSSSKSFFSDALHLLKHPFRVVKEEVEALILTAASASALGTPFKLPPLITSLVSRRITFPLQLQQAGKYVAPRVALIGDAAHSIHPQAGQGLNLGLADADELGEVILQAHAAGRDLGAS